MLPQSVFDEAEALKDTSGHERAFTAYSKACADREKAAAGVVNAEKALAETRALQKRQAERTAAGEPVTIEEIKAADESSREAQIAVVHFSEAVTQADLLWSKRQDELTEASGEIYRAAFDAGVTGRVKAARKADTARAHLAAAVADYELATGLIQVAMSRGCRPPRGCGGIRPEPVETETAEKTLGRAPLPARHGSRHNRLRRLQSLFSVLNCGPPHSAGDAMNPKADSGPI